HNAVRTQNPSQEGAAIPLDGFAGKAVKALLFDPALQVPFKDLVAEPELNHFHRSHHISHLTAANRKAMIGRDEPVCQACIGVRPPPLGGQVLSLGTIFAGTAASSAARCACRPDFLSAPG